MLASFLSEGRCPLLTRQREGEVFVDADRRVICRMSDGAPQRRRPARAVATTRRRRSGKTPHAAFCTWFAPLCKVPGGGERGARGGGRFQRRNWYAAYEKTKSKAKTPTPMETTPNRHKGTTGGGGGGGGGDQENAPRT